MKAALTILAFLLLNSSHCPKAVAGLNSENTRADRICFAYQTSSTGGCGQYATRHDSPNSCLAEIAFQDAFEVRPQNTQSAPACLRSCFGHAARGLFAASISGSDSYSTSLLGCESRACVAWRAGAQDSASSTPCVAERNALGFPNSGFLIFRQAVLGFLPPKRFLIPSAFSPTPGLVAFSFSKRSVSLETSSDFSGDTPSPSPQPFLCSADTKPSEQREFFPFSANNHLDRKPCLEDSTI